MRSRASGRLGLLQRTTWGKDPVTVIHRRYRLCHLRRWVLPLLVTMFAMQAHARIFQHRDRPLVVAYFGQWSLHNNPPVYLWDLVDNGAAAMVDQLNYAHASVKGGRCSVNDRGADLETAYTSENSVDGTSDDPASPFRGYFHQLKELKQRYPKLKVLISLEGSPTDFKEGARPDQRAAFVASCVDIFLRGHFAPGIAETGIFDGIDVDWEYPQQGDAAAFGALLKEFRRQMNAVRAGLMLTIAVGDQPQMQPGTDFRHIARIVDQIGIMNYDYTGPWNSTTGFVAPLLPQSNAPRHYGSIVESIAAYERAGVDRRKLLMGLPFYGYQWKRVSGANNGLFQAGKGDPEDKPYRYIRDLAKSSSVFREPRSRAPWLYDGTSFWTFEDPVSVSYKASYASHARLGGIMIWELGEDTEEATLLNAAWHSLRLPLPIDFSPEEAVAEAPALSGPEPVVAR